MIDFQIDIDKLLEQLDDVQLTPRISFPKIGEGSLFYVTSEQAVCLISNPWRSPTRISEVAGMLDAEHVDAQSNLIFEGLTGIMVAKALQGDSLKYYNSLDWLHKLFAAYIEYRSFQELSLSEIILYEVRFDIWKECLSNRLTLVTITRIEHIKQAFYKYCCNRDLKIQKYLNEDNSVNWRHLLWLPIWNGVDIDVEDNRKLAFVKPNVNGIPEVKFGTFKKNATGRGFISCLINLDYYYSLINRRCHVKDFNLTKWDFIGVEFDGIDEPPSVHIFDDSVSTSDFEASFGIDTDDLYECYLSTIKLRVETTLKIHPHRVSRKRINDTSIYTQIYIWEAKWLDEMVNSDIRSAFKHEVWEQYVDYARGLLEYMKEVCGVQLPINAEQDELKEEPIKEEKPKVALPNPPCRESLTDEQKLRFAMKRAIKDVHNKIYSGLIYFINTAQDWVVVEKFALDLGIINNKSKHKNFFELLNEIEEEAVIKLNKKPQTNSNLSQKKSVILESSYYPKWEQGICDTRDFTRYKSLGEKMYESFFNACIELQVEPPKI